MKKSILLFLISIFTIYNSLFSYENKYIPSNVNTVTSLNLSTLSDKADINLQETLNNLFFNNYADSYLEYRNDPDVVTAMTERFEELFDTTKDAKIITYNNYNIFSIILNIKNSLEMNKILIKIATQEDKLISVSKDLKYIYIMLDEKTLLAWNDEVFTVSVSYDSSNNILFASDSIFSKDNRLEDNNFIDLLSSNNDAYNWVDLSAFSTNSYFRDILASDEFYPYNQLFVDKEAIYDGIVTAKYNFTNGNANIKLDFYNTNFNLMSIKKELSNKVYEYVNGQNNYGFLSFSFNIDELTKELKSKLGEEDNSLNDLLTEFPELKDIGIKNIYSFLELLDGDIFFSVWDIGEDNDPAMFISASVRNANTINMILSVFSEYTIDDDIYLVGGNYLYIKDSILYIVSYENIAREIKEGKLPENKLDANTLNNTKDNLFSFYMDLNPLLSLYGYDEYTEVFKDLGIYAKIIDSNHTQINIDINTRNKEENALKIIKLFMEY